MSVIEPGRNGRKGCLVMRRDPLRRQRRCVNGDLIDLSIHEAVKVLVKSEPGADVGRGEIHGRGRAEIQDVDNVTIQVKSQGLSEPIVNGCNMVPGTDRERWRRDKESLA